MTNCVKAIAGALLQCRLVKHFYQSAAISDKTFSLHSRRDLGNRCPSHSQHLAQKFLSERDNVVFRTIPGLQQPAAESLLYIVECIARRGDLGLRQDYFVGFKSHFLHRSILRDVLAKVERRYFHGGQGHLNDRRSKGAVEPEPRHCSKPALSSDCRKLDTAAVGGG